MLVIIIKSIILFLLYLSDKLKLVTKDW